MGGLAGAWTPADHWEASVALLFWSLDSHSSILSPLLLFFFLILFFKFLLFCYVLCIFVSHFKLCLEQCINKYLLNWSYLITNICLIFMLVSYLPAERYGDFPSGQEYWFDFSNFIVRCQNCNLLIYFLKHMVNNNKIKQLQNWLLILDQALCYALYSWRIFESSQP